jgi:hypothetical protein
MPAAPPTVMPEMTGWMLLRLYGNTKVSSDSRMPVLFEIQKWVLISSKKTSEKHCIYISMYYSTRV